MSEVQCAKVSEVPVEGPGWYLLMKMSVVKVSVAKVSVDEGVC